MCYEENYLVKIDEGWTRELMTLQPKVELKSQSEWHGAGLETFGGYHFLNRGMQ